jgi:hypothetical protein
MFVGCMLCAELLMVLFSINLPELFEVAATDFIAATRHVLAHPRKDLLFFLLYIF